MDDDQVASGFSVGLTPLSQEEIYNALSPAQNYQSELANLNSEWQSRVDSYNRSFAIAALSDGPSEEAKKSAIRASYEADKAQNTVVRAALKAKYGIGGF